MNINHLLLACVAEQEATRGAETLLLLEFLRARIAEDKEKARAARLNNGRWHRTGEFAGSTSVARDFGPDVVPVRVGSMAWDENSHIALHDPARVLAECEAKEQILQQWEDAQLLADDDPPDMPALISALTLTLVACAMTLPYAGHPDYQEDWKL